MLNLIKSLFRYTKTFIVTLLLILLVIFLVNNRDLITIHTSPLPFEIETRIFFVMLFFFLFGMLFGFFAFSKNMLQKSWTNLKNRLKIRKLEKQIAKTENNNL